MKLVPPGAVLLSALVLYACSPVIHSSFATAEDVTAKVTSRDIGATTSGACSDALAYAPDLQHPEYTPAMPVRMNIHFMDAGDGLYNLNEEQGRVFATELIRKCNEKLGANEKMHLPPGNQTPVLPIPWYFVLSPDPQQPGDDGIYFHVDPDLYYYNNGKNTNRSSRAVIDKYAIRDDSVINVFLMPHHPDSVRSATYHPAVTGITLGSTIKIAQVFTPDEAPGICIGLLDHEAGHALGLSHTWAGNDGCDDTPENDNCWYYTDTPPGDSLVSNNMMDYNAWQSALTPCQIGRVLRNIANLSSRVRKFVSPFWCSYDPNAAITISDSVHWEAAKDLAGDIVIADGGILRLSCRLSLAAGARIIVWPGGKLILDNCRIHNACGDQWEGIEIKHRKHTSGIVEMTGTPRVEDVVHALDLTSSR